MEELRAQEQEQQGYVAVPISVSVSRCLVASIAATTFIGWQGTANRDLQSPDNDAEQYIAVPIVRVGMRQFRSRRVSLLQNKRRDTKSKLKTRRSRVRVGKKRSLPSLPPRKADIPAPRTEVSDTPPPPCSLPYFVTKIEHAVTKRD